MSAPATTVTLTCSSCSPTAVTIRAPAPSIKRPINRPASIKRTQAGTLVTYIIGPAYYEVQSTHDSLSDAQAAALNTWWQTALGNPFTYTDENGTNFTNCYLLDPMLDITKNSKGSWVANLHFQTASVMS